MLGTLTGAQKAQVWKKLSVGSKRELKRLAGLLAAAEAMIETQEEVA